LFAALSAVIQIASPKNLIFYRWKWG